MFTPTYPEWPNHTFQAMGCHITIWLDAPEKTARPVLFEAGQLFAAAEQSLSRFNPESELSRLNARPGQWQPVSQQLWSILGHALTMAAETGGLFDPTLLNALEAVGYTRSFAELPANLWPVAESLLPPLALHGHWQWLQRNPAQRTIWLPAGVRLDLGGIAKGCIAQAVVDFLSQWGPCLVDAGGDLTAGLAPAGWPGWPVGIAAPSFGQDDQPPDLFHLWLTEATLATSGTDYRQWHYKDQAVHHLIDPRTGRPAKSNLINVTILSPSAAQAEAWATATLVAGFEQGLMNLTAHNLAGALVTEDHQCWLTPAMQPKVILPASTPI